MAELIEARSICKRYWMGSEVLTVLNRVDFFVQKHDFVAIMGPSGSGKTTLLNILGCLDRPTEGQIRFDGKHVDTASDAELSSIRGTRVGFVFQTFHLVPHLDVYENVSLPFLYAPQKQQDIKALTIDALRRVGLDQRIRHRPSEISGGEMQRAAIARALVVDPDVILADEPTGNLDAKTSEAILELFGELHRQGATIVMVTHDRQVARHAAKTCFLHEGSLQ